MENMMWKTEDNTAEKEMQNMMWKTEDNKYGLSYGIYSSSWANQS